MGEYFDSQDRVHGFLLDTAGSFSTIDAPFVGDTETRATGINDIGQIVGFTENHGFLATPVTAPIPEPSTWLLLGSGLAGLVIWRKYQNVTVREGDSPTLGPRA